MTINSATRKAGPFLGDGVATVFPFAFKVFDKTNVQVTLTDSAGTETVLVLDSDYSVGVNADQTVSPGGAVTYPATLAIGKKLTITGALPNTQPTSLPNNGPFYPSTVEDALDRAEIQIQQLQEKVDRSLKVNVSDSPLVSFPSAAARANSLVGFDAAGGAVTYPITSSVGTGDLTPYSLVSGVDFAPGATSLTLPKAPGVPGNLKVNFDAAPQDFTQWSVNGTILTIPGGVPAGITRVWGYIGTTLSTSIPPNASVGSAQIVAHSVGDGQLAWGAVMNRAVDSYAALRALDKTVYSRAMVTWGTAVGDGKGGPYYLDTSDSTSAENLPYIVVAADGGRWKISLPQLAALRVPAQYGVKGDDIADDTTAMQAFINAGGGWLGANRTFKINGALTLDVSKSYIDACGCVFDFTGGGTLQLYSSSAFPLNIANGTRRALNGIKFVGPNTTASVGLTVGHNIYQNNNEIIVEGCAFFQFGILVNIINNAWRVNFKNCHFEQPVAGGGLPNAPVNASGGGYHIYAATTLANAGEVMQFDHCMFTDALGDLYMGMGQWVFNGCSLGIGATVHGLNSAVINLNSCNLESQPNAGYHMIWLQSNASCVVNGGDFIINQGVTWNLNPILVEPDCSIHLHGPNIPFAAPWMRFENDLSKLRHWAVGGGRVTARGISSYTAAALSGSGNGIGLSKTCNMLANGDAEYGNVNNWTTAAFGTGGSTVAADAAAKLNGNFGFDVQTVSGGGVTARQTLTVPDAAGRLVNFSYVYEVASGSGTVGQIILRCMDAAGGVITSASQNCLGTDTVWTYGALSLYAPPGTTQIQCEFNGQLGPNRIYFDELCLNVM